MLALLEISDRLEIYDLLARYSCAVDSRDWNALDELFADGAVVDYTEMGGPRGDLATIKEFLGTAFATVASSQHLVGSVRIAVDGDTASVRSICHNPMVLDTGGGSRLTFFCGLWYRDRLVRTATGWRFAERYEEKSFFHNAPFPDPA